MNRTNLLIDISIFSAFLVAMEPRLTGVSLHEWLSLALAATIIVHLLMHWKWIVTVGAKFFQNLWHSSRKPWHSSLRKPWHSSRLKFVVDALLFAAFTGIMLSGLMISRDVLPALGIQAGPGMAWRQLHSLSANAGMLLVGLHFALSWNWVVSTVKKYVTAPLAQLVRNPRRAEPVMAEIRKDE